MQYRIVDELVGKIVFNITSVRIEESVLLGCDSLWCLFLPFWLLNASFCVYFCVVWFFDGGVHFRVQIENVCIVVLINGMALVQAFEFLCSSCQFDSCAYLSYFFFFFFGSVFIILIKHDSLTRFILFFVFFFSLNHARLILGETINQFFLFRFLFLTNISKFKKRKEKNVRMCNTKRVWLLLFLF